MAVANGGYPFTERDVVTEIYGDSSNRSLTELFSAAIGTFDPAYVGSKNSLYNFRNYQHTTYPYPIASYYAITINGVFSSFYQFFRFSSFSGIRRNSAKPGSFRRSSILPGGLSTDSRLS